VKNREEIVQRLALRVFELTKLTWIGSQQEKFKGGYDLSESEFLALDALETVGTTLSVGELRRFVGVLPAQMSRIIKALEHRYDEKLVVCSIHPSDKRKINVAITPKGHRAVHAYRDAKIKASIEAFRSLSDEDLRAMESILAKVARAHDDDRPARGGGAAAEQVNRRTVEQ
jgi:DNA-binding MarR family transcriptional regulator